MKKKRPKEQFARIVGIAEITIALNLTKQRISQLVQLGLPKKLRGKYDQDECVGWYIRYLQARIEKRAIDEGGKSFASEREERVRLVRALADLREIELARERGQLVLIDVQREMLDLVQATTARLMAIAPRLASELVGDDSRVMIHAKLERALRDTLLTLAQREAKRI